ncbi:MAG: hypothetical protein ABIQ12_12835 [Opitutaceae bacterium]
MPASTPAFLAPECSAWSLTVPRVAEIDLAAALSLPGWPPTAAATLALHQGWSPKAEAEFRAGQVWLAATRDALLVFAELSGLPRGTTATADHERLWERGDVFEIFLQAFDAGEYFEFQIAPNGCLLQLHYPEAGAPRNAGIERYVRRDRLLDAAQAINLGANYWRLAVRVPTGPLLREQLRISGAEWRVAFCRYDYRDDGRFDLSSTAALTRADFHRIGEWSRASVPGGFSRSVTPTPP